MGQSGESPRVVSGGWLDDARLTPRWDDVRTVLAKVDGDEYLGKTRDVSLAGVAVSVDEARVSAGRDVDVCLVYRDRIVEMRGRVAYSLLSDKGSLIGVSCPDLPAETRDYLAGHYLNAGSSSTVS